MEPRRKSTRLIDGEMKGIMDNCDVENDVLDAKTIVDHLTKVVLKEAEK